jgi:hypothetical protein
VRGITDDSLARLDEAVESAQDVWEQEQVTTAQGAIIGLIEDVTQKGISSSIWLLSNEALRFLSGALRFSSL